MEEGVVEPLDFWEALRGAFVNKFLSEYTWEERCNLGAAIVAFIEKMKQRFWAILEGENWVKEKVAKNIEYYIKRVELIQTMLSHKQALGDAQIRLTLKKDNFDILKDFSVFREQGKLPQEIDY